MIIDVNGVEIYADGSGDLLFIHGAGMSSDVFERQKNIGVAIDLPNHGRSGKLDVKSLGDYAEFLIELVSELGLKPVIAGHSMGGAIAQEYILRAGKARGLILISTGAKLPVNPKLIDGLKNNFEDMVEKLGKWIFAEDFEGLRLKQKIKSILFQNRDAVLEDFMLCNTFNLEDRYISGDIDLKIPVLIVCGNADVMTPLAFSEFLRDHIRTSKLAVIHGSGHMPMVEKPSEFNKIVMEFLRSVE
ncbi:alpha/beta fold hydrolase [Geoglobus acetivorans]|uniref:Carboxylesterase n=1 Tax=Geoglobus acetivorans TaxID=565033 RepID=A0A0A7GJ33_GEOAI|nr:Carboxylesterase [Geoglobus acetivorans]